MRWGWMVLTHASCTFFHFLDNRFGRAETWRASLSNRTGNEISRRCENRDSPERVAASALMSRCGRSVAQRKMGPPFLATNAKHTLMKSFTILRKLVRQLKKSEVRSITERGSNLTQRVPGCPPLSLSCPASKGREGCPGLKG